MPTIAQIATNAVAAAFKAAGDAIGAITIRLGPSTAYDAASDAQTVTWAMEKSGVAALGYADASERKSADPEKKLKSFLVKGGDLAGVTPTQTGEIVEGAMTWRIYRIETDPVNAAWIFHCTA